jgi:hypothetical protein
MSTVNGGKEKTGAKLNQLDQLKKLTSIVADTADFESIRQVRDAEIAYSISPVVRRHRLSAEETEKFLLELRIPRAANVARITDRLVVNCSQKASSELAAQS